MEVAIGLYSLAVPLLFDGLGRVFVAATQVVGESPAGRDRPSGSSTAVLALAPPTLLMGGTLPVLTRLRRAGPTQPGRTAGLLYAANTAGAVLGCCLTGCLLIFWLGVVETNMVAALIDLGVGVAALAWDRRTWSRSCRRGQPGRSRPTRAAGGLALADRVGLRVLRAGL